ncbi:MAG: membrane protein insertase YidC, partial [Prevotella sp.]|nr:membrane protein insertase YidC [Prevotella sp.]
NKNSVLGFILIAAVLLFYTWWSRPSAEKIAEQARADSLEIVRQQQLIAAQQAEEERIQDSVATDSTALFFASLSGTAQKITLRNDKVELVFSSKGATVERAVVKNYTNIRGKSGVVLFDEATQQLNYTIPLKEMNISTSDLYFTPSAVTDTTVTFTATAAKGKTVAVEYRLGKSYMLHTSLRTTGFAGLVLPNTTSVDISWRERCAQQERGHSFENRYSKLVYHKAAGGTKKLSETSEVKDKEIDDIIDWVAYKNQFFSAVMISRDNFAEKALLSSKPEEKGSGYLKDYGAKLSVPFDATGRNTTDFEFYYGPNDFRLLQKTERESTFGKKLQMERLVELGWPLFRLINRWFTIYVFDFLTSLNIPMGVVLILITLLLKVITYPMVKKSYMSSAKMRVLKPKLEEATRQYDGPDRQMQKQQAMMQEYAKYGVSPMAGCLPALIQMPIWVAMFNFVPNAIKLRGESFLWISDLSTYDPIFEWHKNIPLIGDHLSLTCILFCVGQLAYSWMSLKQQKDQMVGQQADQMKMMQWMMMLMPLMFFFIFNDYSSGLNFYYFVSLFMSAVIMWALRHFTDERKLLERLEEKYKENKASGKKLSGLAGRLQAMQEEQARMEEKRKELERRRRGR